MGHAVIGPPTAERDDMFGVKSAPLLPTHLVQQGRGCLPGDNSAAFRFESPHLARHTPATPKNQVPMSWTTMRLRPTDRSLMEARVRHKNPLGPCLFSALP